MNSGWLNQPTSPVRTTPSRLKSRDLVIRRQQPSLRQGHERRQQQVPSPATIASRPSAHSQAAPGLLPVRPRRPTARLRAQRNTGGPAQQHAQPGQGDLVGRGGELAADHARANSAGGLPSRRQAFWDSRVIGRVVTRQRARSSSAPERQGSVIEVQGVSAGEDRLVVEQSLPGHGRREQPEGHPHLPRRQPDPGPAARSGDGREWRGLAIAHGCEIVVASLRRDKGDVGTGRLACASCCQDRRAACSDGRVVGAARLPGKAGQAGRLSPTHLVTASGSLLECRE